jgi:ABC-type phosphate/phosphonate transport system permease subunit
MNENETVVNEIPEEQGCPDCAEYEQAIISVFVMGMVGAVIGTILGVILGLIAGKKLTSKID